MPSPTTSALDLIADSLQEIGVLAAGEPVQPADAALGLRRLNALIDAWAIQRLAIPGIARFVFPLTANVPSYTIGIGGVWNQERPVFIQDAAILWPVPGPPTPVETPVEILSASEYASVTLKTLTASLVGAIYNDGDAPLSRIWVFPIPTVSTLSLVLYLPVAITAFANLSTSYSFPPGYYEALLYNLAVRLAPAFQQPITPDLRRAASEAVTKVKASNTEEYLLEVDEALRGDGTGDSWTRILTGP